MGNGVGGPVGGEEEGRDIRRRGVVCRRGVEFEEVEERQGREEEGKTPEGAGDDDEKGQGQGDADAEGYAETEGA